MLNRYLQIGVVALSLGLLVALFATTEPGGDVTQQNTLKASGSDTEAAKLSPQGDSAGTSGQLANQARAVLAVQGMTCAGCISQIKSSLAEFEGIGDVSVDLANGRVAVTYDSQKLKDTERIAAAIIAAGYPASVKQVLTAKELEEENRRGSAKSKRYIARVGDWEILRADYDAELNHARKRYEKTYGKDVFSGDRGDALLYGLKSQVAQRLIDEGVQLNEIRKTDYKLSPDTLKNTFDAFLNQRSMTPDEFKRSLAETGLDFNYFLKKFETSVTINTYVEDKVLSGFSNEQERQQQYAGWFNNAQLLAQIVYYDKTIENIVRNGNSTSGCRGSGAGGNGAAESGCRGACIRKSSAGKTGGESDDLGNRNTADNGCTRRCNRQ